MHILHTPFVFIEISRHLRRGLIAKSCSDICSNKPRLIVDQHGADFASIELERNYLSSIHGITLVS